MPGIAPIVSHVFQQNVETPLITRYLALQILRPPPVAAVTSLV